MKKSKLYYIFHGSLLGSVAISPFLFSSCNGEQTKSLSHIRDLDSFEGLLINDSATDSWMNTAKSDLTGSYNVSYTDPKMLSDVNIYSTIDTYFYLAAVGFYQDIKEITEIPFIEYDITGFSNISIAVSKRDNRIKVESTANISVADSERLGIIKIQSNGFQPLAAAGKCVQVGSSNDLYYLNGIMFGNAESKEADDFRWYLQIPNVLNPDEDVSFAINAGSFDCSGYKLGDSSTDVDILSKIYPKVTQWPEHT